MNLQTILQRLQGVRRSGDGWTARCPGHEDRGPSLSIREQGDKILLHCFAGCPIEAICAALQIKLQDLFAKPKPPNMPRSSIVREAERQLDGFRSRLTPGDRERAVTVVLANEINLNEAMARALALAVEGELVQLAFEDSEVTR
jgi:hypothetical protein